ncbi:MAG: hypothetical protein ACYCYI_07510 [Saccharofermentanales bacterium]
MGSKHMAENFWDKELVRDLQRKEVMEDLSAFKSRDYRTYPILEKLDFMLMSALDDLLEMICREQDRDRESYLDSLLCGRLYISRPDTIDELVKLNLFEPAFVEQYGGCITSLFKRYNDLCIRGVQLTGELKAKYKDLVI